MAIRRVAFVDEYHVVRSGLRAWFDTETGFTAVADFAAATDCLHWLRTDTGADLVVIEHCPDGRAPDFDCLRLLRAMGPTVVVHSRAVSDEVILSSLDAGAACYVGKSEGREELLAAVTAAAAGDCHRSPLTAAALHRSDDAGRIVLSERERQVLVGWLRLDNKEEVARRLHIAPATVRTHLQRIRLKYASTHRRATTKAALLARAIEDGLIGLGDLTDAACDDEEFSRLT